MRNAVLILFASVVIFAGCQSQPLVRPQSSTVVTAKPPPFQPILITTLGTNNSSDGFWRIGVSDTTLDLSRWQAVKHSNWGYAGWSTTSLNTDGGWRCHPGWIVYTESPSRVWAYDGERKVYLLEYKFVEQGSKSTIYDSHVKFPCAVPGEVFSRLSETARKDIQSQE